MKDFPVDKITVFQAPSKPGEQATCCVLFTGPGSGVTIGLYYPKSGEKLCYMRTLSWGFNHLLSVGCSVLIEYEAPCQRHSGPVHFRKIDADVVRERLDRWECSDSRQNAVREGYLQWLHYLLQHFERQHNYAVPTWCDNSNLSNYVGNMVFSLRRGRGDLIIGRFELLISGLIPEKRIERVLLLELNGEQERSIEFCLSVAGIDGTFANIYVLHPTSDEQFCWLNYSDYTPDMLRSRGWQDTLELTPTAGDTIRSLCWNIHTRELDYYPFQDPRETAINGSLNWAISQWIYSIIMWLHTSQNFRLAEWCQFSGLSDKHYLKVKIFFPGYVSGDKKLALTWNPDFASQNGWNAGMEKDMD